MGLVAGTRAVNGVVIVDLQGRLTLGVDVNVLRSELMQSMQKGDRRFLLNCANLGHVDSAGMGELVSAYSAVVRGGGAMKMVSPSKRLLELLQITHLDRLIGVCPSEEEGLAGFTSTSVEQGRQGLDQYLK